MQELIDEIILKTDKIENLTRLLMDYFDIGKPSKDDYVKNTSLADTIVEQIKELKAFLEKNYKALCFRENEFKIGDVVKEKNTNYKGIVKTIDGNGIGVETIQLDRVLTFYKNDELEKVEVNE